MTILTDIDFYLVVEPILEILDAILWPAIAVVVAVGLSTEDFQGR